MDAELAAIAATLPRPELADPGATRKRLRDMYEAGEAQLSRSWAERLDVERTDVPSSEGHRIPIRIYTPRQAATPRGALVNFHGGAFVAGDLDISESTVARYADRAQVTVVDVDYRLAPEHPFPAGVNDCFAALQWTVDNADRLDIDPARIAVGGNSAGGGLAAAVALMARDRGGPAIAFQLLLYPVLDDRLTTTSVREMTDTPMWDAPSCVHMWRYYLGDQAGGGGVSAYAAPARAADKPDGLAGLPPAYVLACEFDPLRDEDIAYAVALLEAGVSVDLHEVAGTFHGYNDMPTAISKRATAEIAGALQRAIGTP
ncbi:MAG: alpha/beta hydrolase [Actinomycetes bacterium]